jgi:RNA polymerase sigma-70 factor (ECF subfamily)
MRRSANEAARWLAAARAGSPEALGQLLEECRDYLLLVADRELDPALRAKGGASDLVQETFLDAQRDFPRFHGDSETELLAWLRRLLRNNLVSFTRLYRETKKRHVGHEVRLGGDDSARAAGEGLAAEDPSPSRQAMAHENSQAIQQALARLPEDYHRVLLLRYQEELSFEEIGQRMGRTANGARKLWLRAIKRLQEETEGML